MSFDGDFEDSTTVVEDEEGRRWENQVDMREGKVSPLRELFDKLG